VRRAAGADQLLMVAQTEQSVVGHLSGTAAAGARRAGGDAWRTRHAVRTRRRLAGVARLAAVPR